MRGQVPLARVVRNPLSRSRPAHICFQCRAIQISAAPTTESPRTGGDAFGAPAQGFRDTAGTTMTQDPRKGEQDKTDWIDQMRASKSLAHPTRSSP